jgi:hypothetical protein
VGGTDAAAGALSVGQGGGGPGRLMYTTPHPVAPAIGVAIPLAIARAITSAFRDDRAAPSAGWRTEGRIMPHCR